MTNRRPLYYDRDGKPLADAEAWAGLDDIDYRRVGSDTVGAFWVSTVWLGIDHAYTGPPMIFETMVFGPESWGGEYQERYSTEAEALAGHARAVAMVRDIEDAFTETTGPPDSP